MRGLLVGVDESSLSPRASSHLHGLERPVSRTRASRGPSWHQHSAAPGVTDVTNAEIPGQPDKVVSGVPLGCQGVYSHLATHTSAQPANVN